jgi:hypothetical protein
MTTRGDCDWEVTRVEERRATNGREESNESPDLSAAVAHPAVTCRYSFARVGAFWSGRSGIKRIMTRIQRDGWKKRAY